MSQVVSTDLYAMPDPEEVRWLESHGWQHDESDEAGAWSWEGALADGKTQLRITMLWDAYDDGMDGWWKPVINSVSKSSSGTTNISHAFSGVRHAQLVDALFDAYTGWNRAEATSKDKWLYWEYMGTSMEEQCLMKLRSKLEKCVRSYDADDRLTEFASQLLQVYDTYYNFAAYEILNEEDKNVPEV